MSNKTIIILIATLLVLRFATLGLWKIADPSEARYAEISRQILLQHDWAIPPIWVNGELVPFLGKPPLYFWMTAISMKVFGFNAFAARLASFLSAVGLLLFMSEVTRRYFQPKQRLLSLLITMACPIFFFLSGTVLVDMTLSLGISGAALAYFAFLKEPSIKIKKLWSLAVFVFLAIGFLTKGPVAIILFGMPVFCWHLLHGKWQELKYHSWTIGIILFLGIALPWFIFCEQRQPGFFKYFFINENLLRYTSSNYSDRYGTGHEYPYGAAIVMMAISIGPWLIPAFFPFLKYFKKPIQQLKANPWCSFFFLSFVVNTIFWCFARQLLITYMLPMLPLFACWVALEVNDRSDRWIKWIANIMTASYLIALVIGTYSINQYKSTASFFAYMRETNKARKYVVSCCHETPYSAYFNNSGELDIHQDESVDDTIKRCLTSYPGSETFYFLCRQHHLKDISPELLKTLNPVKQTKNWILFQRK